MAGCWGDDGKWHDECSGSSDAYPANGTAAEQSKWLKDHGYGNGTNDNAFGLGWVGWVVNPTTGGLIPPGGPEKSGGGIPIGYFDVNGIVYQWNGHGNPVQASVGETKAYWSAHPNGQTYNSVYGLLDAGTPGVTRTYGDGTTPTNNGTNTQRLASDDPRYWDFQYAQLNQDEQQFVRNLEFQYKQLGQTGENARRSALMAFIQARDSLASNTAQTSANIAETKAKFAANPRDTYAEAIYRGEVGGSTPFGDLNNSAFGEYGKALAAKVGSTFEGVDADLAASRRYRDALPLQDWLPADLRGSSSAGQAGAAAPASAPAGAGAANPSAQDLINAYNAYHPTAQMPGTFYGFNSPEEAQAMAKYFAAKSQQPSQGGGGFSAPPSWSTGGLPSPTAGGPTAPPSFIQQPTESGLLAPTVGKLPTMAGGTLPGGRPTGPVLYGKGGTIDFGNLTRFGADQPTSSEGGTNMNIHEPAVLIGLHSGRHYATVAENGYPEQIKITPTPSGKKAAQEAEKAGKAQKDVMGKAFGQGGTVSADPSIDDMNAQYSQLLSRLGGMGGGSSTPLNGARFLAGAPANMIAEDPYLKGITEASYSMKGIDPSELWAQVAKFTPTGIVNNSPRVSFA